MPGAVQGHLLDNNCLLGLEVERGEAEMKQLLK